jgi:hypothetical protein
MKRRLLLLTALIFLVVSFGSSQNQLPSLSKVFFDKNIPLTMISAPDLNAIHEEDLTRDKNGMLYRIGVDRPTNITLNNTGLWKTFPNGDRQWQMYIKSPGAEAISFLFEVFKMYGSSTLDIQDLSGKRLHNTLTSKDVESHFMQNAALCFGDEMIMTLYEPAHTKTSDIFIDRIIYNYRATGNPNAQKINESDACEINVNCTPVGNNWQDEKRGVARIYVVEGGGGGWCTGSVVNNTALDCKPLFLTALHCGQNATAANMNQWKFYFRYESTNCTNPNTAGTLNDYFITGCVRLSDSNDGGGNSGSDFLLVQMGTLANQATTITTMKSTNFNCYWNGWDANTTATTGGACIHHPAGDIKKISTFNGTTVSSTWGGSVSNTHWRVTWSANSNGHGVTEGGSSGSPLFNNSSGRIIGTLTGGSSYCTALNSPDKYGKMSYHWLNNGTPTNERLKTHLDPGNTGLLVLNGSSNPCSSTSTGPCTPSSTQCDEYINNVQLNTINNTSTCATGGYLDYANISTSLAKNTAYSATITPAVPTGPGAYPDDEVAIWIDYNNDQDFTDAGEQVGYVLVATGWSNVFNFTVPSTATVGTTRMRVRISYYPDGAITPCGNASYGETEDYRINITATSGLDALMELQVPMYPNPTANEVLIDLKNIHDVTTRVSVKDLFGKVLYENLQPESLLNIPMVSHAKGLYHVVIETTQGRIVKNLIRN